MDYSREEIEIAIAQQRQRRLGLEIERDKGMDPKIIGENLDRCDAQIAQLEARLEKLPPPPTEAEQVEAAAQELAIQVKIQQRAQEILAEE